MRMVARTQTLTVRYYGVDLYLKQEDHKPHLRKVLQVVLFLVAVFIIGDVVVRRRIRMGCRNWLIVLVGLILIGLVLSIGRPLCAWLVPSLGYRVPFRCSPSPPRLLLLLLPPLAC